MSVFVSYTSQVRPLSTHKSRDESREDRFQFPISGSPIPKFSIFGSKSDMYLHTYWDLDSGVVLFKPYKLWDNLDRFDPGGLHAFKTNRFGPWRLRKHENNDLRVSKLISRDLYQFLPPKTHFKRSTGPENTHNMFPEASHSKRMCVWIDCDTILPRL